MAINIVVFGNCQAAVISRALGTIHNVKVRHHFVVFNSEEDARRARSDTAEADFVLGQEVKEWTAYAASCLDNTSATIIRFPFLRLAALWPFDSHQNGKDPGHTDSYPDFPFPFSDAAMGRLRSLVPDHQQRLMIYRNLDFDDAPDLMRYYEMEATRLVAEDRRLGLDLGAFILDNFRERRLFHTITHPAEPMLKRVSETLCRRMDLRPAFGQTDFDCLRLYQVPIHPAVIDAFGLLWVNKDSQYNFFLDSVKLNFDEYFSKYISVYG